MEGRGGGSRKRWNIGTGVGRYGDLRLRRFFDKHETGREPNKKTGVFFLSRSDPSSVCETVDVFFGFTR